ncbi:MAG: tetratricopeptide repeat protein [Planctomycetota bacterium]
MYACISMSPTGARFFFRTLQTWKKACRLSLLSAATLLPNVFAEGQEAKTPGQAILNLTSQDSPKSDRPTFRSDSQALDKREIYQRTLHGTVWIRVPLKDGASLGTGCLVDKDKKLVITNHHVVSAGKGEADIYFPVMKDGVLVTDPDYYRRKVGAIKGKIIDSDSTVDLALIELEEVPESAVPLTLAPQSPVPGEEVHSVAGLPQGSSALWVFSTGAVRQVYRRQESFKDQIIDAMVVETQTPVNRGNSGGPVVNELGQLVAVVSFGRLDAKLVECFIDVSEVKTYLEITEPLVHPETAEQFHLRGKRQYGEGHYDRAIEDFNQAIQRDPKSPLFYVSRGMAFLAKKDNASAKGDFDDAIRLDPQISEGYYGRGLVERAMGKVEESLRDLTEAIRRVPRDTEMYDVYNERAHSYYYDAKYDVAVEDYDRAIEQAKRREEGADRVTTRLLRDKAQLYANRGDALQKLGKHDKALADFDEAVKINPENPEYFHLAGKSMQELGRKDEAFAVFSKAIALDSKNPAYYRDRGRLLQNMNRLQEAVKDFSSASDLEPDNAENINYAGVCFYRMGEYKSAANVFELAIQKDNQTPLYFVNLGNSLQELKEYRRSLNCYNSAIQLAPNDASHYASRGYAYQLLGDAESAEADFRKAAELSPTQYFHHHRRYLAMVNESGETLKVYVQYHTKATDGTWQWFPANASEGKSVVFELEPGASVNLYHGEFRLLADYIRFWAEGTKSGRQWTQHKETDYRIAPRGGYLGSKETSDVFTYTFTN